jgi:two-component system, chemotaxis family, chemotaxis protein CheY
MSKRVVLVGHCGPDSSYLRMTISRVSREISASMVDNDAELQKDIDDGVDLLLVNRQLDYGFKESEGVQLIARLHGAYPNLKMMLISNFPESQAEALAAGALPGFGKRELGSERVAKLIREALAMESVQ